MRRREARASRLLFSRYRAIAGGLVTNRDNNRRVNPLEARGRSP
jgi:hypothetical protein